MRLSDIVIFLQFPIKMAILVNKDLYINWGDNSNRGTGKCIHQLE